MLMEYMMGLDRQLCLNYQVGYKRSRGANGINDGVRQTAMIEISGRV